MVIFLNHRTTHSSNTVAVTYIKHNFGLQKQFFKGIWSANHTLTLGHNIYKGSVDSDPTDTQNLVTFEKNIIDKSADYYQFQLVNNN